VFENRVLRRIFGPKRDEVTGERRKLHILYSSPNNIKQIKSRRMRWVGHAERMGEERNVNKVLMGKPEGNRPLGRPKSRWDQNGSYGDRLGECRLDRVGSGQGPVAGSCEYGDEPLIKHK
jgi:hypothetical protein